MKPRKGSMRKRESEHQRCRDRTSRLTPHSRSTRPLAPTTLLPPVSTTPRTLAPRASMTSVSHAVMRRPSAVRSGSCCVRRRPSAVRRASCSVMRRPSVDVTFHVNTASATTEGAVTAYGFRGGIGFGILLGHPNPVRKAAGIRPTVADRLAGAGRAGTDLGPIDDSERREAVRRRRRGARECASGNQARSVPALRPDRSPCQTDTCS